MRISCQKSCSPFSNPWNAASPEAEKIARLTGEATDRIDGTLAARTGDIERLSTQASERIAATIDEKTGRIEDRLGTMDRALTIGLDSVNRTIDGKAFGTMLLLLPDDPNEAAKALSYIRSQPNITAEEVEYHA